MYTALKGVSRETAFTRFTHTATQCEQEKSERNKSSQWRSCLLYKLIQNIFECEANTIQPHAVRPIARSLQPNKYGNVLVSFVVYVFIHISDLQF